MLRLGLLLLILAFAPSLAGNDGRRPAYLLEVPGSVDMVLIAETGTSTLHYFGRGEGGAEQHGGSYMSIGLKGAGKQRAWEHATWKLPAAPATTPWSESSPAAAAPASSPAATCSAFAYR